jgi:RNA recognition motif-containing protein
MNIYVGNLDFKVEENDLKVVFEEYGSVEEVRIIKDKYNGRSRGFGFVVMNNDDEAKMAISELHEASYENRNLIVNEARNKEDNRGKRSY